MGFPPNWGAGLLNGGIVLEVWGHGGRGQSDLPMGGWGRFIQYLLQGVPQVLVCVLAEGVQVLPHGPSEEHGILGRGAQCQAPH